MNIAPEYINCKICGEPFEKGNKSRRTKYCSERCSDINHKQQAAQYKKSHSQESSTPWLKLRYKILARDGFTCQYCGLAPRDGINLQIDHMHPISKGGDNSEENLIVSCNLCNLGKGDSLLEQRLVDKLKGNDNEFTARKE